LFGTTDSGKREATLDVLQSYNDAEDASYDTIWDNWKEADDQYYLPYNQEEGGPKYGKIYSRIVDNNLYMSQEAVLDEYINDNIYEVDDEHKTRD
jgi:hypothetical protein